MTRSNDHTELAWAAAFLESEGSIYWVREKTLVVAAYNTETVLLKRFQQALRRQHTGLYKMRETEFGRKQVYTVRMKSGQAEIALTKLLPYLTPGSSKEVKAREALEARQVLRQARSLP